MILCFLSYITIYATQSKELEEILLEREKNTDSLSHGGNCLENCATCCMLISMVPN